MSATATERLFRPEDRKILVVDDERHIVRLIEINLERAGYHVITAYDGVEALKKVASEKPHMVILDIMMPRMDGWEVLAKLRADPATDIDHLAIIVFSQCAQVADIFPRELLIFVERIFEQFTVDEEGVLQYDPPDVL